MRVLIVTNMYPDARRPAYGIFVREQVESLAGAGLQAEVLFIDGQRSIAEYVRSIPRLRRAATAAFDVVHAHYGLSGWVAACQRRLPLVITFHGDDLLGTPSLSGGATLRSRVARRLGLWGAERAASLVVVSEEMRRSLPARLQDRAQVLPMGIDLERFRPRDRREACLELGLDPDRRRILFVGDRSRPVKRFALAEETASRVRRERPDVDLHVVHGELPERMPLHMGASDVLLLTSSHEGSPMVVKEALACDLPVVSVDVGDVRERIAGVPGCHVAAAGAAELASATAAALDRRARVDGRPAVEPLALPRIAASLLRIYDAAVALPFRGRPS